MRDTQALISDGLLDWYDLNARALPWRVTPADIKAGQRPDPYRIWLSEVMLQQTTVAAVQGYFHKFVATWPTVTHLARAEDGDVMAAWAGLGYYARARNLLKCARVVAAEFAGVFPDDRIALQQLPGIGPYTSAAIAAIAFDRAETVVDGNVERVMARFFAVETPLPAAKPLLVDHATGLTPPTRAGDYAQAVMDLGATICTPRNPACGICPLADICKARALGIAEGLPKKSPKPVKPVRHGVAFIAIRHDRALLLERRPNHGLLGGMLGWPGSDWLTAGQLANPPSTPPIAADWHVIPAEVRHTFTHFHLRLEIRVAHVPQDAEAATGSFVPPSKFSAGDLPTVMRKAYDLASHHILNV